MKSFLSKMLLVRICAIFLAITVMSFEVLAQEAMNTYKGQAITAQNIVELAPKVPVEVNKMVQDWLRQRPDLIYVFSGESYYNMIPFYNKAPFAINFGNLDAQSKSYLELMRLALERGGQKFPQSGPGYSAMLQNFTLLITSQWYLKVSGFFNRRANIQHEMGKNNRDLEFPQELLEQFITKYGKVTYQTISRLAYWLRIKEAREKFNLDRIGQTQMYLVHMPGRPTEVNDMNYVIVEENLGDSKFMHETDMLKDPETKRQFDKMYQYAVLWDPSPQNYKVKDNKIYCVDTEQANAQPPSNFFLKDRS
jgi:hypothetical protein